MFLAVKKDTSYMFLDDMQAGGICPTAIYQQVDPSDAFHRTSATPGGVNLLFV